MRADYYSSLANFEHLINIDDIKLFFEANSPHKFEKLIKGYEFVVCCCFELIIDALIEAPHIIGQKEDRKLTRAKFYGTPKDKYPIESTLEKLIWNLRIISRKFFKAKNEDEIRKIIPELEIILKILKKIFDTKVESHKNKNDELTYAALLTLHNTYNNIQQINILYDNIILKDKIYFAQSTPIRETLNKQCLFEGYKLTTIYLWKQFLRENFEKHKELFNNLIKTRTWNEFDSFFEDLNKILFEIRKQQGFADDPKLYCVGKVSKQELLPLLKEVKGRKLSQEELLSEELFYYPTRIIHAELPLVCTKIFIFLLTGLTKYCKNSDKIDIIEFEHQSFMCQRYSYAILISASMLFSDCSTWLLFLNFCSTGGEVENMRNFLKKHQRKIKLKKLKIDISILENYAKDYENKKLFQTNKLLKEEIAKLRGLSLELLIALIQEKEGYKTKLHIKNKLTENKEIDLMCFKSNTKKTTIKIVECTTTTENIVNEMKEKIKIITKNKKEILNQIGIPETKETIIKGIIVAPKKHKVPKEIEWWDKDTILSKLKKHEFNSKELEKIFSKSKSKEEILIEKALVPSHLNYDPKNIEKMISAFKEDENVYLFDTDNLFPILSLKKTKKLEKK